MKIPPDTFVCIDLETTGLNPNLNEIIEFGAVKVNEGDVVAEFSELVKPRSPIPDHITYLTGIADSDVRNADSIDSVMPRFLDFIRDYRMVGQNVAFDIAFLRNTAGMGTIDRAIDTIGLARILLPTLPSYSLDSLIDFFALDPGKRHRALDDARVTSDVYLRFIDMVKVTPDAFLQEMLSVSSRAESIIGELFEAELFRRMNTPGIAQSQSRFSLPSVSMRNENTYGDFTSDIPYDDMREPGIDPASVEAVLAEGGRMSSVYEGYEERNGQIAMAKMVARAFNDSELLLAEAGTGIGKSVAYLLPSVMWAEMARERVVVSTNTKNLQEQLFYKDVPLIGRVVGFPFRAVILKGRSNYICLHRWERVVESPGKYLSKEERDLILPVTSWLTKTATGDLSETGFFSMLAESGLLERINSDSISCVGARCPSRDHCFVNRVRRAALKAHVIIVNHSLVFSDMISDGAVLGNYSRIIFDEAHNIEKVAIQYLGISFTYYRIRRIINRLYAKNDSAHGLFAMLRGWVDEMSKGFPEFADNAATLDAAIETIQNLRSSARTLFEHLHAAVLAEASGSREGHDGKLRYDENTRIFSLCADAVEAFLDSVSLVVTALEDIKLIVAGVSSAKLKDRDEVLIDIEKSQMDLNAVVDDFQTLIAARGRNVYWFEYSENSVPYSLKVQSAPLDVAEKLALGLYDHMETVVMASATLTVARDFTYIRERLGLNLDPRGRVSEFIASSPFDYQKQAAVFIPMFMPPPKHEQFIARSSDVVLALASSIRRGMLVLFTSRGHLNRTYNDLKDPLARRGVTLLGQGIDGSRNLILRRFKEERKSILFGTDSFWEGVDVPGEALEIVVIMKLPFAVPSEPVIQAQMEEIERAGGRPFVDFSVPECAIKLRQGAGRLIRHRNDRGIVVVLDTRIITAWYGDTFRRSLPGNVVKADSIDSLVERVMSWFG